MSQNVLHAARWNRGRKNDAKTRHLGTIAQLCRAISSQLRHVSTLGKNLLNSNTPTCSYNMVNFGLLAAEIVSLVWGTPATFNGFYVLAALLHGTPAVGQLCGVEQRAPPIFGRAPITLGIGPRSSLLMNYVAWCSNRSAYVKIVANKSKQILAWISRSISQLYALNLYFRGRDVKRDLQWKVVYCGQCPIFQSGIVTTVGLGVQWNAASLPVTPQSTHNPGFDAPVG